MKNWLFKSLAGVVALATLSLSSCEKDEDQVTLTPSNTPTLSASATNAVLTQANAAQTAVTYTWSGVSALNWSGAEHTYKPTTAYSLQFSTPENNFGAPASITVTSSPATITVGQLNDALSTLGLPPGVAATVNVRLAAIIGTATNNPVVSPVVPITVTPYKVCVPPNSDTWSIIGPAGVDWSTDVPLTYDCDTKTYKLTRALNVGDFKFRKNSDWTVNYGANVGRDANGSAPLAAGGGNIAVATAGTYTITLDLNNQKYTLK